MPARCTAFPPQSWKRYETIFQLKRFVGQRRVARAENKVRPEIDSDLILQCLLNVDFADHTETFGLERFAHAANRIGEISVDYGRIVIVHGVLLVGQIRPCIRHSDDRANADECQRPVSDIRAGRQPVSFRAGPFRTMPRPRNPSLQHAGASVRASGREAVRAARRSVPNASAGGTRSFPARSSVASSYSGRARRQCLSQMEPRRRARVRAAGS